MLSSLPNGIFSGLTALTSLRLGGNTVAPMPIIVSLEQVSSNQYRVVIPTGAPFDVSVPIVLTGRRSAPEGLGSVIVSKGNVRSDAMTVPVVRGTYIDIGALPLLPANHFGYVLSKSATCNVTLQVAEAIAAAVPGVEDCRNVSQAQLAAITSLNLSNKSITSLQNNDFTDLLSLTTLNLENNLLSSLPDGIFAGMTSLNTLQLSGNTGAPFSFEVSLEKVGTNQFKAVLPVGAPFDISLPITVTNGSAANSASSITIAKGSLDSGAITVTRAANTVDAVTVDIGTLPSIPTAHNGYALSKSIDLPLEIFGAIKQHLYSQKVRTATRSIAENTAAETNIGSPVSATDANSSDRLVYTLSGTDAASFAIVDSTGQLQTKAALDHETQDSYTVTITVSDGNQSDTIDVTITVSDVVENKAPVFTEGATATRSIAENTPLGTNIGSPVAATDADSDTLIYALDGTNANVFSIASSTGQLQTKLALNYESKQNYKVTVTATDGKGGSDSITVTINITNVVNEDTQQLQTRNDSNRAPVFTEGATATRSIAENTVADTNIGAAVSATDDGGFGILSYTLGGTDVASFDIVSTTGQLKTKAELDFETKTSYTVTITVSDSSLSDTITVTINVTDVVEGGPPNNAPAFTEGTTATRSIAENTVAGTNIGAAVSATDVDEFDTLIYTLGGTDVASFDIVSTTGQLQTKAELDFETETSYTVTITVSDSSLSDTITVTIKVTDVVEGGPNNAPAFTDGDSVTLYMAENTPAEVDIGAAISATDDDSEDTLTYTLSGTDAASFTIVSTSGQLKTKAALDYETKNVYKVTITGSDGKGGTDTIAVTINISNVYENVAPVFPYGASTSRSISENVTVGTNIGTPFIATDANLFDTFTYTLGGTDAASFTIESATGQLKTKAALDFETKTTYKVTVTVSDGNGGTDTVTVRINIIDVHENVAPVFADGGTTTQTIAENTVAGTNIGSPIGATDANVGDTLIYTLSGTDAASFAIVSRTGQLQTKAALDFETTTSYSVTITVSDGENGTDTIDVTINVTNVVEGVLNNAPMFTEGRTTTRSIAENTASGTNIGSVVTATDANTDTLSYTLGGVDANSFTIVGTSGQLQTSAALNYEDKNTYTVTATVSDNKGGTDSIDVTINVTDVNDPPRFVDAPSATITIPENTGSSDLPIGDFDIIDEDMDRVSPYVAGLDAATFRYAYSTGFQVDPQTHAVTYSGRGDLRIFVPRDANLDYEAKTSYSLSLWTKDSKGATGKMNVTINLTDVDDVVSEPIPDPLNAPIDTIIRPPVFWLESTAVEIAENTVANQNIGGTFNITDYSTVLTYTLGGTDAASFAVVKSGNRAQLRTKAALDYETKSSYSITITADNGQDGTNTIIITINITDLNEAPAFAEGETVTRTIAENSPADINIGSAVSATDPDADDTVTYTLGGTDAAAFTVDNGTGQLKTKAALDFETTTSYTVTLTATDEDNLTDSITVTINVGDLNEAPSSNAPVFTEGATATRSVAENLVAGTNIGTAVTATDVDPGSTLSYQLSGADGAAFSIEDQTGQLKTNALLDYETKDAYSVTITVTDGSLTDTITVTINVTDANDAPVFSEGNSTTRIIDEGVAANRNIGPNVLAIDADRDTLTYTLGGTDGDSFSIDSGTGQLKTKDALRSETKASYVLTVTVSDDNLTDIISVTINVINVNRGGPAFHESEYTLTVEEGTPAGVAIGDPITAQDIDDDALTYDLFAYAGIRRPHWNDFWSFSVESTTGQIKTNSALNYDTQNVYKVTLSSFDGRWRAYTDVIINVTRRNNSPVFSDGRMATRSVAENSAAGVNIGTAVSATDVDSDTLTYSLGGIDAASFSIDSETGQLKVKADLDHETQTSYSVTVTVFDGKPRGAVGITVTINVTNVANEDNNLPVFTENETTTRSVAENTAAGTNIGAAVSATDLDNDDMLTYSLGGTDADSFAIDSSTGQLKTKAALDFETITSYTVTITVSDGRVGGTDMIMVTINVTNVIEVNNVPEFTEGAIARRSVAENTAEDTSIGNPVSATDADLHNSLTYSLGGTDAASFAIVSPTGQLKTKAALDFETKTLYTVTVTVSDGDGGSDSITINIHVTDVVDTNRAPVFQDGTTTTRTIVENTAENQEIGDPVTATDPDNDSITYTFGGTDASSFNFDASTAQIKTKDALDFETTSSYTVTVTATDTNSGSTTTTVTIRVTNSQTENTPPVFTDGASTTRTFDEHSDEDYSAWWAAFPEALYNVGTPIAATDADDDTLTYEIAESPYSHRFIIDSSGQLTTDWWINYENKSSYPLTITVSDGNGGTDSIDVTVNVTDVNEQPYFGTSSNPSYSGSTTIRYAIHGAETNTNISNPVTASDVDANSTLTYSLSGTDVSSFTIDSTTGQLTNNSALDVDTKDSYSVVVTASDGNLSASINVTVNVIKAAVPAVESRSAAVRAAIVNAISDVDSAADVNAQHLSQITNLSLSNQSITALNSGDFNGLFEVTYLNISNNELTSLPSDIFDDLTALQRIDISYNRITSLEEGIFENNANLIILDIAGNPMHGLPNGFFAGMTSLMTVYTGQMALVFSIEEVSDDDNDAQTSKYRVKLDTGAPADISVDVWSVDPFILLGEKAYADIKKHKTVSISRGSVYSDVITIARTDNEGLAYTGDLEDDIHITVKKTSHPSIPALHDGYYYINHSSLPLLILPSLDGRNQIPGTAPAQTSAVPKTTALLPNFPNPFNPETWIPYQLSKPSHVSITIYDIRGNVVRRLDLGQQKTGYYTDRSRAAHWDGRNSVGEHVANGIYFYKFEADGVSALRKMLIVK